MTRLRTRRQCEEPGAGVSSRRWQRRYGGTRLGRQELDGELVEDREDALWSRAMLEEAALDACPELRRIVVAVDPPASARKTSDACGIVAAGLDGEGDVVVLADATREGRAAAGLGGRGGRALSPAGGRLPRGRGQPGRRHGVGGDPRGRPGGAGAGRCGRRRGKWIRAEPVAMLYQQGRVRHAGRFAALEDEMCDFGADGLADGRSPDRVDALVWAVTRTDARGGCGRGSRDVRRSYRCEEGGRSHAREAFDAECNAPS